MVEPMLIPAKGGAQEDRYVYDTCHERRGKALIFSIREFNIKDFPKRKCADSDFVSIKPKLRRFGFEVEEHRFESHNKSEMKISKDYILKTINKVADEDHKDADCFLCVFMSYGYHGVVWASDEMFPVEELQAPLKGNRCPSLAGKPKIFLFQTCLQEPARTQGDAEGERGPPVRQSTIPAEADFLFFWSHIRFSDERARCSVFIDRFTSALEDMIRAVDNDEKLTEDFLHLCIRVTGTIEEYLRKNHEDELQKNPKLVPLLIHMLTKDLYLLPPKEL